MRKKWTDFYACWGFLSRSSTKDAAQGKGVKSRVQQPCENQENWNQNSGRLDRLLYKKDLHSQGHLRNLHLSLAKYWVADAQGETPQGEPKKNYCGKKQRGTLNWTTLLGDTGLGDVCGAANHSGNISYKNIQWRLNEHSMKGRLKELKEEGKNWKNIQWREDKTLRKELCQPQNNGYCIITLTNFKNKPGKNQASWK